MSSRMVSPLPATSGNNMSRRDSSCCNVLERIATFCLHLHQKVSLMQSTKDFSKSTVNNLQSQWFQNPARPYLQILLDHTLSKVKTALKSTLCVDPATSCFKIVELPVTELNSAIPMGKNGRKGTNTHKPTKDKEAYFDKSSAQVCALVKKIWFSHYP